VTGRTFDQTSIDVQATPVEPVAAEAFDFEAYADYEASLLERCRDFWQAESGALVWRRVRTAEVFTYGCRDMKASLRWQLGGLQKSMEFKADVPNFLVPWYGIGIVASAFGIDYGGRVPISQTDTQSPLNIACNIVDMSSFFIDMFDEPEAVKTLLNRLADLLADFAREQIRRIGEVLVWPGHGYASCRSFEGLGMSDDNASMISPEQYFEFAVPAVEYLGERFAGSAFHSCGNWSDKVETVKKIPGLRMVDGAFSAATDPSPNPPEPFAEAFANTVIVVNARMVGGPDTIADSVRRLWRPPMKLIVVTYCQQPQEQAEAYDRIHEICG